MAKMVVMGCACVIASELTPVEINLFKRYRPSALKMVDEDNSDEQFSLTVREDSPGSLTDSEAVFSDTESAEGKATITILLDPCEKDKLGLIRSKTGCGLCRLQKLEERLLQQKDELLAVEQSIDEIITVL